MASSFAGRLLNKVSPRTGQHLVFSPSARSQNNALRAYHSDAPSAQNAIGIFEGEWSSTFPPPFEQSTGGTAGLFQDGRIDWFLDQIGGVQGRSVLELGPLEGGHSYMLHRAGSSRVVAVEANNRAYLKCLIVKELFTLDTVRFLYGDLLKYLDQEGETFEVGLACGILYHMVNPAELVQLLAKRCSEHILVWTHYYDSEIIERRSGLASHFCGGKQHSHAGFRHTLYRQNYGAALHWKGYCGGSAAHSAWMPRNDLFDCFEYFGLKIKGVAFDDPDHPNGPSLAFVASAR